MQTRLTKIKTHAEGDEFIGEKGIHAVRLDLWSERLKRTTVNVANSEVPALLRYDGRGTC